MREFQSFRSPGVYSNERFWIIQVVAKQENPGATLEAMRPVLEKLLGARREEAARTDAQKKLRSEAKVEYLNPALLSPAAPVKNPDAEEE